MRQGSLLSPLLFNVFVNDFVAHTTPCTARTGSLRTPVILYADDIVLLATSPQELQAMLDAAHNWACTWRLHFATGSTKSAVLVVLPARRRRVEVLPTFLIGLAEVPVVGQYRYLGVWFGRHGVGVEHVEILRSRGLARCSSTAAWAGQREAPFRWRLRLWQSHAHPAVYYGSEFLPCPHLGRIGPVSCSCPACILGRAQSAWTRRTLGWPARSPGAALSSWGDLRWLPAQLIIVSRRAALWARLRTRQASPLARMLLEGSALRAETAQALAELGLPSPSDVIPQGGHRSLAQQYTRDLLQRLQLHAEEWHRRLLSGGGAWRLLYGAVARSSLYRLPAAPAWQVSAWTRLRCGMQWIGQRAGGFSLATCPYCDGVDSVAHALLHCPLIWDHALQLPDYLQGQEEGEVISSLLSTGWSSQARLRESMRYVAAVWALRQHIRQRP